MGVSKFTMWKARNDMHVKVSKYAHTYALEIHDIMSFRRLIPAANILAINMFAFVFLAGFFAG
jgi:hypothetical protein